MSAKGWLSLLKRLFCVVLLVVGILSSSAIHAEEGITVQQLITNGDSSGIVTINEDMSMSNQIVISKDITIRGSSQFVISALQSRHFVVNSGVTLVLENITLDGGDVAGGILLKSGSKLVMKSGAVLSNNYTKSNGGAINSESGFIHMESGSSVISNKAGVTQTKSNAGKGGGLYLNGDRSKLIVEKGAIIADNTATYEGGGIYMAYGETEIYGQVQNNHAYISGGGMTYYQRTAPLLIEGALFEGNKAYAYALELNTDGISNTLSGGGAMYLRFGNNGVVDIKDTTIINNHVLTDAYPEINDGKGYYTSLNLLGGGIWASGDTKKGELLKITNSRIEQNTAVLGGGVYSNAETEISNTDFIENTTKKHLVNDGGGAIFFLASRQYSTDKRNLKVYGGSFIGNVASEAAGIMFGNGGWTSVFVDGALFRDNLIRKLGYKWDAVDPIEFMAQPQASLYGLSYLELYNQQNKNIKAVSSPYSNLYNHVDIFFWSGQPHLITFDPNGGQFDDSAITYAQTQAKRDSARLLEGNTEETQHLVIEVLNNGTLDSGLIPIRDGFNFLGWVDEDGVFLDSAQKIKASTVYTATWEMPKVVITYTGGEFESVQNLPQEVWVNHQDLYIISDSIPTLEGYKFNGWDVDGTVYKPLDSIQLEAKNVTFTAFWELDESKIVVDDIEVNQLSETDSVEPIIKARPEVIRINKKEIVEEEKMLSIAGVENMSTGAGIWFMLLGVLTVWVGQWGKKKR